MEITKDIKYVGVNDHKIDLFEGQYEVPNGMSYNSYVILDEKISSKEDVKALGIRHGDFISVEPRCQVTENGYIKSRFIDDKGAIACVFTMLKYLSENNLKPKYRTMLAFSETGFVTSRSNSLVNYFGMTKFSLFFICSIVAS